MIFKSHSLKNTLFSRSFKLGTNIYFLLGLILFSPIFASAQADEPMMCAQVIKSAISPSGHCQTFKTPCDIPQDWKMVPSCDMVEKTDFGASPADIDSRRLENRWQVLRDKMTADAMARENYVTPKYHRIGAASLGRAGVDREAKGATEPRFKKRTMSNRKYHSRKYNIAVDYRRDKNVSKNEWEQRRKSSQTRLRYGSPTKMDRNGPISSKPKWFVSSRKHFKDNLGDFGDRWRSSTQILQEDAKAKRDARGDTHTDGPALQKIYTGVRRAGNLEKALLNIE